MEEDLNPELYKFLICKLSFDLIRNPSSKLAFYPWLVSTKSWNKHKPSLQKLVQSKSVEDNSRPENFTLPRSPTGVYFNHQGALKKSMRFAASITAPLLVAISSNGSMLHFGYATTGIDFKFPDDDEMVEQNDCGLYQLGSEYSMKDQLDGGLKTNQACFSEKESLVLKDVEQVPATNGLSYLIPNDDEDADDACWKTFNLITPKAGEVSSTVFKEDRKDVTAMPGFHARHNQTSPGTNTNNAIGKSLQSRNLKEESFKDILVTDKYSPLKKSASEPEELVELCVDEIEGESLISKLKRQVELSRKTVINLYKEIDEERNAAAEAASQSMAMITKLQEEKALIKLDAHQCIRMMEEQAEHNSQALEEAYELVAEKEKEMQELEAELKFYRSKYPDEYREEQMEFIRQCLYETDEEYEELEGFQTHITESIEPESLHYPEF